jgi:hypothetical protein
LARSTYGGLSDLPQTGPGGVVQTLGVKVRDVIGKKFKKCCLH